MGTAFIMQESLFTAGLRCHYFAQVACPHANQLESLKSALQQPIIIINYKFCKYLYMIFFLKFCFLIKLIKKQNFRKKIT